MARAAAARSSWCLTSWGGLASTCGPAALSGQPHAETCFITIQQMHGMMSDGSQLAGACCTTVTCALQTSSRIKLRQASATTPAMRVSSMQSACTHMGCLHRNWLCSMSALCMTPSIFSCANDVSAFCMPQQNNAFCCCADCCQCYFGEKTFILAAARVSHQSHAKNVHICMCI